MPMHAYASVCMSVEVEEGREYSIYVSVCFFVCVCVEREKERKREREKSIDLFISAQPLTRHFYGIFCLQ